MRCSIWHIKWLTQSKCKYLRAVKKYKTINKSWFVDADGAKSPWEEAKTWLACLTVHLEEVRKTGLGAKAKGGVRIAIQTKTSTNQIRAIREETVRRKEKARTCLYVKRIGCKICCSQILLQQTTTHQSCATV